ncbi:DNA topoisomerase IV subunit A [Mycoplasmopsis verecunda]|uniref:DNA topoisomerase (ATP-hydrolyzing) n=1 Tax=Mycoplasmopsis verecunda TaxID=171291 RepID=A0A1T4L0M1_9BACT|nr:DNA topoisomerase IV subunit A [Mycoplasmopsis verecunda]WPB54405.1 DNA topoisomerase IV subunit A [Mycoplasmopsis verecunda]SJZ48148.1 topoisomerase-4 subunit A [Mycoplasmopsis verecunda]
MKKEKEKLVTEKIINETLDRIMADRFGRYSKYVIQQRALPDVRDGLKPVQRRILYAMFGLGLFSDKQYKKSARVVGDVIGKYHPHGDSSVYEAMVNMSQWWKMNIPLLDMHGNVGSIDNDPAAAMRYTEVRLSKISEYIIGDIKKETVKFAPNFDDSEIEPTVLPSIFPNLLVNGSMGIAIGMATDMPPHNLGEIIDATIYRILNPYAQFYDVIKFIKGPDFPTGGVIRGTKGIIEAFDTGRNQKDKIRLFAKYNVYSKDKFKYIEITEIPYGVVKSKLVYDIDNIINNKDIDGILEIKDQSDREGINILITLDADASENSILTYLFQKTDLQVTYSYNNTCIVQNSPKTLGIIQLIDCYINHVKDIKTKTLIYDLEKYKLRLEIVEGFIKVSEITDKVIEVIRKTEGSKSGVIENLINVFDFTKNQATAIAELRLYRLSKTDKEAYLKEKADLLKEIKHINLLLSDDNEFNSFIIDQLSQLKLLFAKPRKTQILDEEFDFSYNETDLIKEEMLNIGLSRGGYIKRLSQRVVDSNNFETYNLKDGDNLIYFGKVNSINNLLIFTSLGNYLIIPAYKIQESKWKDLGFHLSNFADFLLAEEVVSIFEINNWDSLVYIALGTKNGYFKKTLLQDFSVSRINKSYTAIGMEKGDFLLNATICNGSRDIVIVTENGFVSRYSENDLAQYGTKAKGNKGIYLSLNDKVKSFTTVDTSGIVGMMSNDGQIIKIKADKLPFVPKTIKGKPLLKDIKKFSANNMAQINDETQILTRDVLERSFIDDAKSYPISNESPRVYHIGTANCEKTAFNVKYYAQEFKAGEMIFSKERVQTEAKTLEQVKILQDSATEAINKLMEKINKNLEADFKKDK